ncbi:MAG: hypothetical protein ACOYU3_05300 [Bacillota bacterium]
MAKMNTDSDNAINLQSLLVNPWANTYWFARMLINGDKYGSIGKESKLLSEISLGLRKIIKDDTLPDETKVKLSKDTIKALLYNRFARSASKTERVHLFFDDVSTKLKNIEDVIVFVLTAESILIPINKALEEIPSNDRVYTEATAKAYLDELGDDALATVIGFWDDAGVEGCLNAERVAVVREFTHLRRDVSFLPEFEANLVLTAFMQEYERRLGQKRKARAGGSLEDVTSFLFDYYHIKAAKAPEHFQADIEVDKWIRCKDKWLIGISCKRTLRERWKQVSSATAEVLGRFKIKQLWHLVTYDEDLSDEKLSHLGGMRHIFYLRDDSRRLAICREHIGLKDYVRPMSSFIDDLKKEIG